MDPFASSAAASGSLDPLTALLAGMTIGAMALVAFVAGGVLWQYRATVRRLPGQPRHFSVRRRGR